MSINNPLVSVCVQTYQHASYIEDCINSILKQETNFPFEILLGEDDSTDGTREICQEFAKKFPDKIRLFLNKRKDVIYINGTPNGRGNLINNLNKAKGKYIALCEGDDYWYSKDKLQKQFDVLEANPRYSGCYHDTFVQRQGGAINWNGRFNYFSRELETSNILIIRHSIHTSSFFFRQSALPRILPNWFYSIPYGDMGLFYLISLAGKIKYVPGIASIYRKHEGGITQTSNYKNTMRIRFFRIEMFRHFGAYTQWKYQKAINREIRTHLIHFNLSIDNLTMKDYVIVFYWIIREKTIRFIKGLFNR